MNHVLRLFQTEKFSVLGLSSEGDNTSRSIPVIRLVDLLSSSKNDTEMKQKLWIALESYGFIVLSYSQSSEPGRIIHDLKDCIHQDFFPDTNHASLSPNPSTINPSQNDTTTAFKRPRNVSQLQVGSVYLNERNVPMYKLGYELCDDIREVYRVHTGSPDSQPWPTNSSSSSYPSNVETTTTATSRDPRSTWLRGMALCRHICDEALHLCLGYDMKVRPGSGVHSWKTPNTNKIPLYQKESLEDRFGDKSVMYAMHYFNDYESILARTSGKVTGSNDVTINVKEHTDPSLFVLEPFLADEGGLQVYPRPFSIAPDTTTTTTPSSNSLFKDDVWIACDGISSPIRKLVKEDEGERAMILFIGRAFAEKALEMTGRTVVPTLHRVVGPSVPCNEGRRTVIYEQKYEEYFPPSTMD